MTSSVYVRRRCEAGASRFPAAEEDVNGTRAVGCGGNWNNSSNDGLGYMNCNNERSNANNNYSARSASLDGKTNTVFNRPESLEGLTFAKENIMPRVVTSHAVVMTLGVLNYD